MNKVIVRAPVRADLAGGTLDLWPIYLFHPGSRTVNVAISYYAESEVVETGDNAIEIHLTDAQYRQRYESLQELAADSKAALIFRAVEHFHLKGLRITTRTDAPRGSGLGGSSALTITLVRALSEIAGAPLEGDTLINTVRDLETRLLGIPAGIQDYYPPVYGGLAALHLEPGAPVRHPIVTPLSELSKHFILHYCGVAHFSGTNNWEMYKRQIEGKKKVHRGFDRIAANSVEMEHALETGDFKRAGKVLAKEWESRKALIAGISTPEIDAAIAAALEAGAWGGKVCGAGGGGCVVFLAPPDKRQDVIRALATVPGRVLDVEPVAHGLTIQRGDDATSSTALRPRYIGARAAGEVDQLYVHGGRSEYKPHVLAEGIVTLDEPRSGARHVVTRTYIAPLSDPDTGVVWQQARMIDADALDIRAVPDARRSIDRRLSPEALAQSAGQSEDAFKQFLADSERMRIYHNPEFNIFSEPGESREAFAARCSEEARRRVEDAAEQLEATFRRRIDQLRERSEREDRVRESESEQNGETAAPAVNVAWGQTLYNITSGRPAAVTDAPQSVRETDYLENIAQIQKAWDRELQVKREELNRQAEEIQEIVVVPAPKNVEITKFVILWTGNQR